MSGGWTFSPEVIAKASRYIAEGRVKADPETDQVYWITGTAKHPYRVQTDADRESGTVTWIGCSCAHGKNLGAGSAKCSHAVAALLAIRDGLTLPNRTN